MPPMASKLRALASKWVLKGRQGQSGIPTGTVKNKKKHNGEETPPVAATAAAEAAAGA